MSRKELTSDAKKIVIKKIEDKKIEDDNITIHKSESFEDKMKFAIKLVKNTTIDDLTKLSDYDYHIYRIFMSIISYMRFRGINKNTITYQNKKQLHAFIADNLIVLYHEKNSFSKDFLKQFPSAKDSESPTRTARESVFISQKKVKDSIIDGTRIFQWDFFILPHFIDQSWLAYPQLLDSVKLYEKTEDHPAVYVDSKFPLIKTTDPIVQFLNGHEGQVVKFEEIRIGDPPYPYITYRYIGSLKLFQNQKKTTKDEDSEEELSEYSEDVEESELSMDSELSDYEDSNLDAEEQMAANLED